LIEVIVDDEEAEQTEELIQARLMRKKERREFNKNLATGIGMDDDTWNDIQELFGDGNEYAFALALDDDNAASVYEVEYDPEDGEDAIERPKRQKEIKLSDVYEPSEITDKMLTENDELIRVRDIPERLQSREESIPSDKEIGVEALYIAKQLKKDSPEMPEKEVIIAVKHVLKFLKVELLEVPFIFAQRKDYFDSVLRHYDLWKIVDMDMKYKICDLKKKQLINLIEMISKINPNYDPYVNTLVSKVFTIDEAADVSHYMQIKYPLEVEEIQQKESSRKVKFKRANWKVNFDDAKRNNIDEYAQLFGIKLVEYVTSVTSQRREHFPEDHYQNPLESAVPFLCDRFPKPVNVIEAARSILGHQIASHPGLRQFIRRVYFTDAVVSVTVSEKGKHEIQPFHPYYPFKYLLNKPIYKFNDGQFLQILDAESKGLLKISICVEEEALLLGDCMKFISNDDTNENAEKWNKERQVIALYATKNLLFPHAYKWMKDKLASMASEWVSVNVRISMEKVIFCYFILENQYNALQKFKSRRGYDRR
jgi:transcription elongation factor SPT6